MEKAIRRTVRKILEEPIFKIILEEELFLLREEQRKQNLKSYKIKIDEDCRIFFTDFDCEVEIRSFQAKALYLFYLLCPDKVSNEELFDYKEVLEEIYSKICNFELNDNYRTQKTINGLLVREGGISDSTSKIKAAISKIIQDEELIEKYMISGKRKKKRQIAIPKENIWIENKALTEIKKKYWK